MLNAAMIGLGWWGKRLVQSVQGSSQIRFARGVTLEPELARDFAAQYGLAIGTSFAEVLADPAMRRRCSTPARGRASPSRSDITSA
jgi:predicted dehydrogenase